MSPSQTNSPSKETPSLEKTPTSVQWPSDEQPLLASQAEDMASLLQSDVPAAALSERLLNFAQDVRKLEERASKYQAEIQKQHVQLQHLSEVGHPQILAQFREEVRRLKEENKTPLSCVIETSQRQTSQPALKIAEVEHGWMTVGNVLENNTETPSMMQFPDSPLMKRIDELQDTNAKLFKANKDWHTKWEALRQSKQAEREELASHLRAAEEINKKLKADLDSMESKLKEEKEKGGHSRLKEKDTQIGLLKKQLTVFMEDFEKEKKEKRVYQERLLKNEAYTSGVDQKLQSLLAEMKLKDEQLKAKAKEVTKLQQQKIELKNESQLQKRLAAEATKRQYLDQYPESSSSANRIGSVVYPSNAGNVLSTMASSMFAVGPRRAPEELPGAWTCPDCTYINYPDRTVCDICGLTKHSDGESSSYAVGELQSRGNSPVMGMNVPDSFNDVEVDFVS